MLDFDMFDMMKEEISKTPLIKKDNELFLEKNNEIHSCFSFKNVGSYGQSFVAMIDSKILFRIKSSDISKKERSFLKTFEGVSFAISQIKTSSEKEDFINKLKGR